MKEIFGDPTGGHSAAKVFCIGQSCLLNIIF